MYFDILIKNLKKKIETYYRFDKNVTGYMLYQVTAVYLINSRAHYTQM